MNAKYVIRSSKEYRGWKKWCGVQYDHIINDKKKLQKEKSHCPLHENKILFWFVFFFLCFTIEDSYKDAVRTQFFLIISPSYGMIMFCPFNYHINHILIVISMEWKSNSDYLRRLTLCLFKNQLKLCESCTMPSCKRPLGAKKNTCRQYSYAKMLIKIWSKLWNSSLPMFYIILSLAYIPKLCFFAINVHFWTWRPISPEVTPHRKNIRQQTQKEHQTTEA